MLINETLPNTDQPIFSTRFGNETKYGGNICCTGRHLDVGGIFKPQYGASGNLTTFMQQDMVTWDLGYVRNGGYGVRSGLSPFWADFMQLEVELLVGDQKYENSMYTYPRLYMSVVSGDVLLTTTEIVKVKLWDPQSNCYDCKPNVVLRLTSHEPDRVFLKGEKLWASGTLHHLNTSRAETRSFNSTTTKLDDDGQFTIRLIMPYWLDHIPTTLGGRYLFFCITL